MTEEIAFADWSKKIERSGNSNDLGDESGAEQSTNSWLPAYGFYQAPSTLLQNNKNLEFYSSDMTEVNCTSNLLLETIMEETSDDLRSETSESEYNSGLLTDSVSTVIHVPSCRDGHRYKNNRGSYWGNRKNLEINTDPGVQDDDDDDDNDYENDFTDDGEEPSSATEDESDEDIEPVPSIETLTSSRTNSLLQFENLEKHYENIFHPQRIVVAGSDDFGAPKSFTKRNARLWAFKSNSQPEKLNNLRDIDDDNDSSSLSSSCSSTTSEMVSSDEILSSSYSSMRHDSLTTKRSLRSSRSVDSLTASQPKHEKNRTLFHSSEFSQSLNSDMSKLLDERVEDAPAPTSNIYKTIECLSELCERDMPAAVSVKKENEGVDEPDRVEPPRSVENLSEDSGFGDHVIARNGAQEDAPCTTACVTATAPAVPTPSADVPTTISTSTTATSVVVSENDADKSQNEERVKIDAAAECGRYDERGVLSKFSPNVWQSDSDLLNTSFVIREDDESDVETVAARNDDECYGEPIRVAPVSHQHSEDNNSSSAFMASRMAVASTPNLYNITDEEYAYKRGGKSATDATLSSCNDSTVSLSRVYSLKRINFETESKLGCSSSKGSNIQIMTSFVNLANPYADGSKGVHFCPVVSEVSWQDSYSSDSEENLHRVTNSAAAAAAEDDYDAYGSTLGEERCSYDRELTPHIDELVEKLLSESVSARRAGVGDKGNAEQRVQSTRLDLITSPPPDRSGGGGSSGGNHVMHAANRESGVNNSWSQLSSSTASSQFSAAFSDAFDRSMISDTSMGESDASTSPGKAKSKSSVGKFFQRFSLKRLSGRKCKSGKKSPAPPVVVGCVPKSSYAAGSGCANGRSESYVVPLSDSGNGIQSMVVTSNEMMVSSSSKPPLPPFAPARRRPSAGENVDPAPPPSFVHAAAVEQQYSRQRDGSSGTPAMLRKTPHIDPHTGIGLLETDIDSNVTLAQNANVHNNGHDNCANDGNASNNKKSRSLLNLDNGRMSTKQLTPTSNRTKNGNSHHTCNDSRAKSMEFLLDKENQAAVQAPENELQKGSGERKMSEHELRVQRSLQKLNVPEWYRNSSVPTQGFLLKRHSDAGQNQQTHHRWNASTLPSKTTSLSSLGSNLSTTPRSPSSTVTSPGPSQYSFSRWSTSRLNSGANSASTSPCGSARSSFNHRQPYLGWRSQEKLSKPRTPAERLAAGILPQNHQIGSQQSSPSLTEVRSSIKEVTSAIVHYVSGTCDSSDRLSPSLRCNDNSSKSASPRGSTSRLCWVESSFVGNRPTNVSEAPYHSSGSKQSYAGQHVITGQTSSKDTDYQRADAVDKSRCEKENYNNRMNGNSDFGMTIKTLVDEYELKLTNTETNFNAWASSVTTVTTPAVMTPIIASNITSTNLPTITTSSSITAGTSTHTTNNPPVRLKDYTTLNSETATLDDILDSLLGLSPSAGTPSSGKVSTESVLITSPGSGGNHSSRSYDSRDNIDLFNTGSQYCSWSDQHQYRYDAKRRRSEGNDLFTTRTKNNAVDRRISCDVRQSAADSAANTNSSSNASKNVAFQFSSAKLVVQCRYPKCGKTAEPLEAKRTYKVCHNCDYVYCSRECRRQHWQKHRKLCLNSRVGDLCRRVLTAIVQNGEILLLASRVARKGFLAHGRGCVKFYFHTPQLAEQFLISSQSASAAAAVNTHCPQPAFNKWADLLPSEVGSELYGELSKLCKSYNADKRFVLVVAVHVVSEIPSSDGAVKWERQIISRYVKTKLSAELLASGSATTRVVEPPQTLILTSLPCATCDQKVRRRINFTNIQRHLRQRGVDLREQFPGVYKKLCEYVENDGDFAATTIYPTDSASGKTFMCVIMLDTEPEKLDLVAQESAESQTIDVASSTPSECSE